MLLSPALLLVLEEELVTVTVILAAVDEVDVLLLLVVDELVAPLASGIAPRLGIGTLRLVEVAALATAADAWLEALRPLRGLRTLDELDTVRRWGRVLSPDEVDRRCVLSAPAARPSTARPSPACLSSRFVARPEQTVRPAFVLVVSRWLADRVNAAVGAAPTAVISCSRGRPLCFWQSM